MTTLEKLFVQIFERKNSIVERVKQQSESYSRHLASELLIEGISPPPWLWNSNSNSETSDLADLKKEELISELLLPCPRPVVPSSYTNCSLYSKSFGLRDNGDLSEGLYTGNYVPDGGIDTDYQPETMHESHENDAGCALKHVTEANLNAPTPHAQVEGRISNIYSAPDQSLARIQRSKSRQKALEQRKATPKSHFSGQDHTCDSTMDKLSSGKVNLGFQSKERDGNNSCDRNLSSCYGQSLNVVTLSAKAKEDDYIMTRSKGTCSKEVPHPVPSVDSGIQRVTRSKSGASRRSKGTCSKEVPRPVPSVDSGIQKVTRSKSGASIKYSHATLSENSEAVHLQNVLVVEADCSMQSKVSAHGTTGDHKVCSDSNLYSAGVTDGLADVSPEPSDCRMSVMPKTLDFNDMEQCSLNSYYTPNPEIVGLDKPSDAAASSEITRPSRNSKKRPLEQEASSSKTKFWKVSAEARVKKFGEIDSCAFGSDVNQNPENINGRAAVNEEQQLSPLSHKEDVTLSNLVEGSDGEKLQPVKCHVMEGSEYSSDLQVQQGDCGCDEEDKSERIPSTYCNQQLEPSSVPCSSEHLTGNPSCLVGEVEMEDASRVAPGAGQSYAEAHPVFGSKGLENGSSVMYARQLSEPLTVPSFTIDSGGNRGNKVGEVGMSDRSCVAIDGRMSAVEADLELCPEERLKNGTSITYATQESGPSPSTGLIEHSMGNHLRVVGNVGTGDISCVAVDIRQSFVEDDQELCPENGNVGGCVRSSSASLKTKSSREEDMLLACDSGQQSKEENSSSSPKLEFQLQEKPLLPEYRFKCSMENSWPPFKQRKIEVPQIDSFSASPILGLKRICRTGKHITDNNNFKTVGDCSETGLREQYSPAFHDKDNVEESTLDKSPDVEIELQEEVNHHLTQEAQASEISSFYASPILGVKGICSTGKHIPDNCFKTVGDCRESGLVQQYSPASQEKDNVEESTPDMSPDVDIEIREEVNHHLTQGAQVSEINLFSASPILGVEEICSIGKHIADNCFETVGDCRESGLVQQYSPSSQEKDNVEESTLDMSPDVEIEIREEVNHHLTQGAQVSEISSFHASPILGVEEICSIGKHIADNCSKTVNDCRKSGLVQQCSPASHEKDNVEESTPYKSPDEEIEIREEVNQPLMQGEHASEFDSLSASPISGVKGICSTGKHIADNCFVDCRQSGLVQQCSPASHKEDNVERSSLHKNPDGEIETLEEENHRLTEGTQASPELQLEEDGVHSLQRRKSTRTPLPFQGEEAGPSHVSSFIKEATSGSYDWSSGKVGLAAMDSIIHEGMHEHGVHSCKGVMQSENNNSVEENNEHLNHIRRTPLEMESQFEEDHLFSYHAEASPEATHKSSLRGYHASPDLESFVVDLKEEPHFVRDTFNFDKLELPSSSIERASVLEQLCRSASSLTPLTQFSTAFKLNRTPDLYQSVPNGLLEHIESRSSSCLTDVDGDKQVPSSHNLKDQMTFSFHGPYYSDYMPPANARTDWSRRKPQMSPVRKFWERASLNSSSSERNWSLNPELTCFPIEEDQSLSEGNENREDFAGPTAEEVCSERRSCADREPLAELTEECINPPVSVSAADMFPDRSSLNSVNTDASFSKTRSRVKQNPANCYSNKKRRITEAKETRNVSSIANSVKKATTPRNPRVSKPKLSGKVSLRKGGQSLLEKETKRNNIVSNIASFVPLVQQKQEAAVPAGKRDVKVKALEAAEAAKRLEEKKQNERKIKKEAMKLERARIEQENLKQMELKKKMKEEEQKKKGADVAARKRLRDEEERKEKERKRKRLEGPRRQQREPDEKLRGGKLEKPPLRATHKKVNNGKELTEEHHNGRGDENIAEKSQIGHMVIDDGGTFSHTDNILKPTGVLTPTTERGNFLANINQEDSYEISPYQCSEDEEDEEDEIAAKKFIPSWASKSSVALVLASQKFLDPDEIFPPESFGIMNMNKVLRPPKPK